MGRARFRQIVGELRAELVEERAPERTGFRESDLLSRAVGLESAFGKIQSTDALPLQPDAVAVITEIERVGLRQIVNQPNGVIEESIGPPHPITEPASREESVDLRGIEGVIAEGKERQRGLVLDERTADESIEVFSCAGRRCAANG